MIKFLGGRYVVQRLETGLIVTIVREVMFFKGQFGHASFPCISVNQSIIRWNLANTTKQWAKIKGGFSVRELLNRNGNSLSNT